MRFKDYIIPLASLFVACTSSAFSNSPWGVCAHPTRPATLENFDTAMSRVKGANVEWLRTDIQFSRVMQHGLDRPDFNRYDPVVKQLDEQGISVLAVLQAYDWEVSRFQPEFVPMHEHPEAWRVFVRAVAEHYKGRITHYSIWNEHDGGFWKPHPDAQQYVKLLKIAYEEIKAVDPDATVMVGGLVRWHASYLNDMYSAGAKGHFDMLSVHTYGQALDQNLPMRKEMVEMLEVLAEHGDAGIPIWITECGASSNEPTILYRDNTLMPAAIRYSLGKIGQSEGAAGAKQLPRVGVVVSERTKEDPELVQLRSWLPGVRIEPVTQEQLATLSPDEIPVLIGAERLHVDAPLLPLFQRYVEQGGLLILGGHVPLFGVFEQRQDGSWSPAIDRAEETQSPLKIAFSAWWIDSRVPKQTSTVKTADAALEGGLPMIRRSYVDRVLRPDRMADGDTYYPLVTAYGSNGQPVGEAMALYTYKDKKGGVLAVCTPPGGQFTEKAQAELLPRVFLTYLSAGANIEKIFWYDLHNDGPSPYEAEDNFGLLNWNWTPKPAWYSYREMTNALGADPQFVRRIIGDGDLAETAWALLFRRVEDDRHVLAVWTTDPSSSFVVDGAVVAEDATPIVNDKVRYLNIENPDSLLIRAVD